MSQVIHILFGAGFTVAVCLAAGWLLLRRLKLDFRGGEAALFAFLAGSACLSTLMFFLCLGHLARRGVLLCGGLAVIAWALGVIVLQRDRRPGPDLLKPLPRSWWIFFWVAFAAFFIAYFFNALAPEVSPDGAGYHLGNVARYGRLHGFAWDYISLYSAFSQGMEMLFLLAFTFGRHSAAALVHMAFQTALPLLMVCYGRRFDMPRVGICAALLVYSSPVAGMSGVSAYNDLTVATLLFAVFYLLQVWDEIRSYNLLLLIGVLSGFAYAVKYTAAFALVFTVAFIWLRARRLRPILQVSLAALTMVAPWVLRNWLWLGNPAAPFLNRWFPNPFFSAGGERSYIEGLAHYPSIKHYWNIPIQLTIKGGLVPGTLGPVFLLAPLGLLALRYRQGRRLLAAGALFAIPAYFNTDPRFLIPVLPFAALAMGMAVERWRGVLPALAVLGLVLGWPTVLPKYTARYNWCLKSIPVRAALRKEPEADYLRRRIPEYALKEPLERAVRPGEKIFSFAGRAEAYLDRDIWVGYESALGMTASDTLRAATDHPPKTLRRFRFLPVTARGVRVVQTASANAEWTVAEMRVLTGGRGLPRSPHWRLSAWPNGWDVQLAFDNNYATRWSTVEAMRPRAFVAVEFGRSETLDEVDLECFSAREARLQVEVLTVRGEWVPLTDTPEKLSFFPPPGMRRGATLYVKSRGLGYVLIDDADPVAEDMRKYTSFWGIVPVAAASGMHLYRIE